MKRVNYPLIVLALVGVICLTTVVLAQEDSVLLRYRWIPEEVLGYKVSAHVKASSQGRWLMTTDINIDFTLTVRKIEEDIADVDLQYLSECMTMKVAGAGKMEVTVDKDKIEAFLNGEPLPRRDLEGLKRELRPVQELMKHPVTLQITPRGEILGVEGADEEMKQYFTIGMVLPEAPLEKGDKFESMKSFGAVLPELQDDVELTYVYIFQGIEGDHLAHIDGSLVENIKGVIIEGFRCDLNFNITYTSFFDTKNGYFTREEGKGKVIIDAVGAPAIEEEITIEAVLVDVFIPNFTTVSPRDRLVTTWGSIKDGRR